MLAGPSILEIFIFNICLVSIKEVLLAENTFLFIILIFIFSICTCLDLSTAVCMFPVDDECVRVYTHLDAPWLTLSCCSTAPPSVEQEMHDGALLDTGIK